MYTVCVVGVRFFINIFILYSLYPVYSKNIGTHFLVRIAVYSMETAFKKHKSFIFL